MILGAHESSAGGCHLAWERAARDGAQALQIWTRSSRQWAAPPLDEKMVAAFRAAHRQAGRPPTAAHASYLINLAAPAGPVRERSIATLVQELQRAATMGLGQVIVHPGAAVGETRESGVARVGEALREVLRSVGKTRVRLLLEITAGQGSCVGCSFEELAEMLSAVGAERLGVCLDTQHLYAAGYDWTTPRGYDRVFDDFERIVGLRHLYAFHLNDSKKPLGARVDRHAPIGHGLIGAAPFARLVHDARFAELPGYLETPPLPSGEESYADGLRQLRSLKKPPRRRS